MIKIKTGNSYGSNLNDAVQTLSSAIHQTAAKYIMFFASPNYDLKQVGDLLQAKFPQAEVCGCVSVAEISNQGFTESSISATCIASEDFRVDSCIMTEIKNKTAFSREKLIETAAKIGLDQSSQDGVILALIDSQARAEERVLFTVHQCFPNLKLVGGSSGNGNPVTVYAKGEVHHNAAVMTFIKTSKKIFTYKENIFTPTENDLTITKANILNRTLNEINGKPATEEYARILGLSKLDFMNNYKEVFFTNPFGRIFGRDVSIVSPLDIVDQTSIQLAAIILPGTKVRILKPVDVLSETRKTIATIKENIPNPQGVILFNCILRYMLFKKENLCHTLIKEYSQLGEVGGFVTLGEQYNRFHVNQTLTLVAFGE